jgi:hypothetical protein
MIVEPASGKVLNSIEIDFSVDGLAPDGQGGFLASDWRGKTVRIDSKGKQTVIMDTSSEKINSADIDYILEESLLVIPTFMDNRAVAYRLGDE